MRVLEYAYRKQLAARTVPQRSRHLARELASHQKPVGDAEEWPQPQSPDTQGKTPDDRTPR